MGMLMEFEGIIKNVNHNFIVLGRGAAEGRRDSGLRHKNGARYHEYINCRDEAEKRRGGKSDVWRRKRKAGSREGGGKLEVGNT